MGKEELCPFADSEVTCDKNECKECGIIYDELYCSTCGERTRHTKIDTWEGDRWQCEICGTKRQ